MAKIWRVQSDWQWDDTNQTDLPIATTTLVADQQDYSLPSTAQQIEKVAVLNSNNQYIQLLPIDLTQIPYDMSEFFKDSGMPKYYDIVGRSLMLYPKPALSDVTLAAGLKIYVSRGIDEFTTSDTSQEPGFANNFHRLLSAGASIDYATGKQMQSVIVNCSVIIKDLETEMESFYANRNKELRSKIIPNSEQFI